MKLVLKKRPKNRALPARKPNRKVLRFMKRLGNGDLLIVGFVPRYKIANGYTQID